MRILLSVLLVFGIVAGLGAAIRGPHWAYGPRYRFAYGGPCGPGWYGGPEWSGPPWGFMGTPSAPAPPPRPQAPQAAPVAPAQ